MNKIITILALYSSVVSAQDASALSKARALPSNFFTSTGIPQKPVIAHRGASGLAPEETKPAYLLARELGADYLELDLHRTKSETSNPNEGVLVAIHDEDLTRTSNVSKVFPNLSHPKVGDLTYPEIMKLDFGSWYNNSNKSKARISYVGLKILTLDEIITIAESGKNKPGLYIETKSPELYPDIEKNIVDVLQKRGWLTPSTATVASGVVATGLGAGRVIFQSFEITSLARFQLLAPNVPRIYLTPLGAVMSDTVTQTRLAAANGVGPFALNATPAAIDEAHAAGLIVHPYVLNAEWQMNQVEKNGADGFFTDNCDVDLVRRGKMKPTDIASIFKKIGY